MLNAAAVPKRTHNEDLKEGNPLLSGNIAQTLADSSAVSFTHDDYEYLKFHGIYQQDDRDLRKTGKQFIYMVRTRFPGGTLSADQYLACDTLAGQYGNNTLRITTRQDFQLHGVVKSNLRQTMKGLNEALMSTLAACGDVARNVMAPPTPATSPLVEEVLADARVLSTELSPKTHAYHSIWLEGTELDLNAEPNKSFVDPLYGKTYLPRKFKVAFAFPPLNDVDIFANDLGFVVVSEGGVLVGYTVLAGGGLGMSHGNAQTFPRLADVVGYIPREDLVAVSKAVLQVHRDFGDRTNRKHARLKYVIEERGLPWFRQEVEARLGKPLAPAKPFEFTRQGDVLGWNRQLNGKWFLGLFVENGRVLDREGYRLRSALREIVSRFKPEVRLTASQNLLLVDLDEANREAIHTILASHGVDDKNPYSASRLASMACPAMPTCGLALAESERALPDVMTRIDALLADVGLKGEEVIVRMTGCPNGCARPYMAELAFVGKAPGKYQVFIGGNEGSTRLNWIYKESVKVDDLEAELRPLFARFHTERNTSERFGDWCARTQPKPPAAADTTATAPSN